MTRSLPTMLPRTLRVTLLAATLAVPLATTFGPSAQAQGWGEERRERPDERGRQWEDRGRREGYNQRERYWDDRGPRDGYYRRPDLYYSAPPVVVHHPDYYRQPSPGISFQLPYFYR